MGFKHVSFHARDGNDDTVAKQPAKPKSNAPKTKAEPKALAYTQDGDPQPVEAQRIADGKKCHIPTDPSATLADFGFTSKEGPAWRTAKPDTYNVDPGQIRTGTPEQE